MYLQRAAFSFIEKHKSTEENSLATPGYLPRVPVYVDFWKLFLGQPGRTSFHRSRSPPRQQAAPGLAHLAAGQLLLQAGWVVLLVRFLAQQTGQRSQNQLHSSSKAREQITASVC